MQISMSNKAQLISTTNSQGWALILQLGEDVLSSIERQALDCDDDSKVLALTRKAQGAREFWNAFVSMIDNKKSNDNGADSSFVEVMM